MSQLSPVSVCVCHPNIDFPDPAHLPNTTRRCFSRVTVSFFGSNTFTADFFTSPCARRPNMATYVSNRHPICLKYFTDSHHEQLSVFFLQNLCQDGGQWPAPLLSSAKPSNCCGNYFPHNSESQQNHVQITGLLQNMSTVSFSMNYNNNLASQAILSLIVLFQK